ncbi:MAG TPA: hypothetical protein VIX86_24640 [Streptosporangiaceae bacterium]
MQLSSLTAVTGSLVPLLIDPRGATPWVSIPLGAGTSLRIESPGDADDLIKAAVQAKDMLVRLADAGLCNVGGCQGTAGHTPPHRCPECLAPMGGDGAHTTPCGARIPASVTP